MKCKEAFELWFSSVGKHYNADVHEIQECFFDAWNGSSDEIAAMSQRVKELEESTTLKSWFEANKRVQELEKSRKFGVEELEKCIKERNSVRKELAAMRKGETE